MQDAASRLCAQLAGSAQRVVAFCASLADTGPSLPGVRLVVDTGLVEVARHDPARGVTVLERIHVCKAIARQRQRGAGRGAEGACVRLYADEDLSSEVRNRAAE